MTTQNHIIKKQVLDFTLDSETGSFTFQSRVSEIFKTKIISLIDAHCSGVSSNSRIIRIDKLEIDLGVINKNTFEIDFKRKFDKLFPEILAKALGSHPDEDPVGISDGNFSPGDQVSITRETREFEILEFFIKTGRLPWWVKTGELCDIPALIELNVTTKPAKMKKLLTVIVGEPALVKRLVYHSGDPLLEKMVALFQPQQYKEICKLSHNLIRVCTGCSLLTSLSPSKIRPEVWSNILSQCFTFEGQSLNRLYIIQTVVKHISKTFGADYNALYSFILKAINIKGSDVTNKPGLEKITGSKGKWFAKTGKSMKLENIDTKVLEADITARPLSLGIIDIKIKEYLRQLETIEKCFKELHIALLNEKTTAKFPFSKRQLLKGLVGKLDDSIELIQNINNMVDNLQKQSGKTTAFSVTPPQMDEALKIQAGKIEESVERLHFDLASVLNKKILKANYDLVKKIEITNKSINELTKQALLSKELLGTDTFADSEEIFICNAGIVLLWPYLTSFFESLGLVKGGRFIDEGASERAALILHYLAFGSGATPEYELVLNKIVCGIRPGTPIKPYFEISGKEVTECKKLLQAVIRNWPALKNVSVSGLRKMFLQREGMIFTRDGHRILRAAGQTYDILLDQMPWGIGTVKLPWMAELLLVEWRI